MRRTYKDIVKEIDELEKRAEQLTTELRERCPHHNIKYESFVNDDWAQHKTYTTSYMCPLCGLYGSYDEDEHKEPTAVYLKLKKIYDKQDNERFHKKYPNWKLK